jgi:hypothetical protein
MALEEISNVTPCRVIQAIPKIMSMPSSAKKYMVGFDSFTTQLDRYVPYDLVGSNFTTRC